MKRSTAIKNINTIIRRVKSVNGLLGTPKHRYDFVKIKRVWLFGSTAKGSTNPNDIDIFVEIINVGPHFSASKHTDRFFDKKFFRCEGVKLLSESSTYAIKWLRSGMKMVSIHRVGDDLIFDELDVKIMLYPRNDFKEGQLFQ